MEVFFLLLAAAGGGLFIGVFARGLVVYLGTVSVSYVLPRQ